MYVHMYVVLYCRCMYVFHMHRYVQYVCTHVCTRIIFILRITRYMYALWRVNISFTLVLLLTSLAIFITITSLLGF